MDNNFQIKIIEWKNEDLYYANNFKHLNVGEQTIFRRKFREYGKQMKNYDFIFFDHPEAKYIIFQFRYDDTFSRGKVSDNTLYMPKNFYEFMGEMGLTLEAATKLYDNFSKLSKLPYHPINNTITIKQQFITE